MDTSTQSEERKKSPDEWALETLVFEGPQFS
jgi:hypothetical protein